MVYTERHRLFSQDMTEEEVTAAFVAMYGVPPADPPLLHGDWLVGPIPTAKQQAQEAEHERA